MERKRKEQCTVEGSPYGKFSIKDFPRPNIKLFELRYRALLLNAEFQSYCKSGENLNVLKAWNNIDKFMETATHLQKCLLFYGNIFFVNSFKESLDHFLLHYVNVYIRKRGVSLGFKKLTPDDKVPEGGLTISFDPTMNKGTLIKMFKNFLDKERTTFICIPGSLPGYFIKHTTSKPTVKEISKYLHVYELKKIHPKTWYKKAKNIIPELKDDSGKRTLRRYAKAGENLSYWAARGIFPKVSNPTK